MNKDYILIPLNEGQELNYMECLSNTRKYIDQRAMEIVTGLSKILRAGTITCEVECSTTNEKWIVAPPPQPEVNSTILFNYVQKELESIDGNTAICELKELRDKLTSFMEKYNID